MHWKNGFFMNWSGAQKGEGIEFFLLLLSLSLILLIAGGGKASIDAAILGYNKSKRNLKTIPT
jgi:putative oxidoreductase